MTVTTLAKPVLVADLFCGAGGSSTGAKRALEKRGLKMQLVALNHWNVAIETHSKNHPDANHFLVNVYRTKPREAIPGGRLDLLMASPTCTFYSRARGGKPISKEQKYGRMTPTQVIRWVTDLKVKRLIVENVPEFVDWCPVHPGPIRDERCLRDGRCLPGRPCARRRGMYFRAWIRKLERAGFRVEWRILNAADYGDVTTRQRFFLIGRSDRKRIKWPQPSHGKQGQGDLFASSSTKPWRAAREIIDWSLLGRSIFHRKKPLSSKTLARILAGAERFNWPEPFLVILRQHMDGRSLDRPLPTICAGGTHIGLAQPVVVRTAMPRSNSKCYRSDEEPLPTVTTDGGLGVVQPVILPQNSSNKPRSTGDPIPVITTTSRGIGLAQPFVLPQHGGGAPRDVKDPIPTVTQDGAHALLTPYYGNSTPRTVDDPVPTLTTKDRLGLVTPVTHQDKSQRARSVDDPLPTITGAKRGELAFIVAAFGERPTQSPRTHSIDEPAPTICAKGRIPLVEGCVYCIDILFRMLQPHELAAAMGFSDEEMEYEFVGTKTEIIQMIGNAVPVWTASALVGALFD